MAEATEAVAGKKTTEYTQVKMTDGREVSFAGKRKLVKETVIDPAKVELDGDILQLRAGAVSVRLDFLNGETRCIPLPLSLLARFAGHGGEQKYGDELATKTSEPLTLDDMVLAIDDLDSVIQKGEWGRTRAAGDGGVSGASVVIRALMEVTGKDMAFVKAHLQKKLDADPELSRRALYNSFRVAGTKTGQVIKRIEDEKLAKTAKVDADAEVAAMS